MVNKKEIIDHLMPFGLTRQEAEVYIALYNQGAKTPLSIAEEVGINRTTSYRVLGQLTKLGLAKQALDYKSTSFVANSLESLTLLVSQKETEAQKLRQNLAPLDKLLADLPGGTDIGPTKVYYFKGVSGLRQLLWNTLSAHDEVIGFGYEDWNIGIGRKFAEKIRAEYIERNLSAKELLNEEPVNFTDSKEYLRAHYEYRIIQKTIVRIHHDTYIYNDVFAFYYAYQGELFGVELHNTEIANTERQLFYLLWKQAKKIK